MKYEDEDYEIKFWKEWLHADILKRQEMVRKLPIVQEWLKNMNFRSKSPKQERKMKKAMEQGFVLLLNSYFEDLESAVYTKVRLEEKRKK